MRLADLARVGELKKSLDYLETLRKALTGRTQARIRVGDVDLRPTIAAHVVDHIEIAIDDEARAIRTNLAQLGVTVEGEQ